MTVIEGKHQLHNPTGCPVTHYHEVNMGSAPAGAHFDNFDRKREEAPIHVGDANGPRSTSWSPG